MAKKLPKSIPNRIKNKEKLFGEIPVDCEDFFVGLGYASTAWTSQKTRIANKLNMTTGMSLSPNQIYQILKHISTTTSKTKNKAIQWLNLFTEAPEDEVKEMIETPLIDVPDDLLKKYSVKVEDISRKHFIIKKQHENYLDGIKIRLERYRFEYDRKICYLLQEMYERGLL